MSTLSQFAAGGIKSIQRGTISVNTVAAATITAVNTAKTMLNFCGSQNGYSSPYANPNGAMIQLTSSTQVTATAQSLLTLSPAAVVSYEVIEYF
jgi:hypothetical protein